MITWQMILIFSSLKIWIFHLKISWRWIFRIWKKRCFFQKLDKKVNTAEIDQMFFCLKIFSRRYDFPSYLSQHLVSICSAFSPKKSAFSCLPLVSHGIKMLKIFLQIKYSNKCHLSRQLGGGGVPLQSVTRV